MRTGMRPLVPVKAAMMTVMALGPPEEEEAPMRPLPPLLLHLLRRHLFLGCCCRCLMAAARMQTGWVQPLVARIESRLQPHCCVVPEV